MVQCPTVRWVGQLRLGFSVLQVTDWALVLWCSVGMSVGWDKAWIFCPSWYWSTALVLWCSVGMSVGWDKAWIFCPSWYWPTALVLCASIVVEKEDVLMEIVWGGDWTLVPDLSWSTLGKLLVRHTALWRWCCRAKHQQPQAYGGWRIVSTDQNVFPVLTTVSDIKTRKRLKTTLFIMTKHNMRIFR